MFPSTVTFYITKTENKTRRVKVLFWSNKTDILQINADISKIKKALVLKGIFSEATFACVHTCQI